MAPAWLPDDSDAIDGDATDGVGAVGAAPHGRDDGLVTVGVGSHGRGGGRGAEEEEDRLVTTGLGIGGGATGAGLGGKGVAGFVPGRVSVFEKRDFSKASRLLAEGSFSFAETPSDCLSSARGLAGGSAPGSMD